MPLHSHAPPDNAGLLLRLVALPSPISQQKTILIVDQDPAVRDALSLVLNSSGFKVQAYRSARDVLGNARVGVNACLLIEFDLEDMTGAELLQCLNARRIHLPAIMMSARLRPLVFETPRPPGLVTVLQKPFGREALLQSLGDALGRP
jgi:two-component system response regulator FixJ